VKIAIINRTDRRAGGVEAYLARLIPALRLSGHDVFFWHERDEPAEREVITGVGEGPACCAATKGAAAAVDTVRRWRPDVLFVHHVENPDLERALQSVAPGVFFAHEYYGTCISGTKTVRLPVLQPCDREFGPACLVQYFPRRCGGRSPLTMIAEYRKQSARLELLRRYAAVLTFSEHMRSEYLKHGFQGARVHSVPAIDPLAAISGAAKPIPLRQPARDPAAARLAFVGRVDRLKGCMMVLDALTSVRAAIAGRIRLTVAGDGPELPRCREYGKRILERLPDTEIVFLGWSSPEQCADVLDASDVLVVPSLWPEPFGLVGIEALRRGVPVAAFAVGGIPEWLDAGKTGALAPGNPPRAKGLADAIVRCLTSDDIRKTARDRVGETASRYAIERHLHVLLPLLAAAGDVRTYGEVGHQREALTR
jgi:glycosyltransferase involved in cell wall biosynthesis